MVIKTFDALGGIKDGVGNGVWILIVIIGISYTIYMV